MRTSILLLLFVAACGSKEAPPASDQTPPAAPPAAPPVVPAPPAVAQPQGPFVEDPTFDLRLSAPNGAHVGQPAALQISLAAKGAYHVNAEYPIRVHLSGPAGVAFAKADLMRADAAEFAEKNARFDVAATPSAAGTHRVVAQVDFAVCSDTNCVPDRRTVALDLAVQ